MFKRKLFLAEKGKHFMKTEGSVYAWIKFSAESDKRAGVYSNIYSGKLAKAYDLYHKGE